VSELRLLPKISGEADGPALRRRRVHQLADRRKGSEGYHFSASRAQHLDQLGTDAGLTGFTYSVSETSAPYSQTLANLLAFFQSDAPARSAQSQSNLSLSGLYFYTGDVQYGPDDFEYQVFSYRASADSSLWNYVSTTTLGTYGPGNPCPAGVSGGTCPAFEAGFVVSSVQPVPLPNSAGLTVLGLSVLAGCLRRRPAPSEARSGLQFPWACW
jgi:hypothetical protein